MSTLDSTERQELSSSEATLARMQRSLDAAAEAGALDADTFLRFTQTVKPAAARLNELLVSDPDDETVREIIQRLLSLVTLDASGVEALDAADHYLVELEAIRHLVRDLIEEGGAAASRGSATEVVGMIESRLPTVPVSGIAALLGVSVRQLQRRRLETSAANSREQLVARLVRILVKGWTDAGVEAWFHRPRPELGGLTPLAVLDDPAREQDLWSLARAGRVQGGS